MSNRVTLVTTAGEGSMDRYGRLLAAGLDAPRLELDISGSSAEVFNVGSLSAAAVRALAHDAAIVRTLRAQPGIVHLAHHHLARYANALANPFVLTVHDLIRWFDLTRRGVFINAPNLRDRLWLRLDYAAVRRATAIIAVSQTTRNDLVTHLRVPTERISVVYEGLDHELFRPTSRRLAEGPYLLYVGSEHPRKNLGALLRAFAALRTEPRFRHVRLVKVGAAGSTEAAFRAPTLALLRELRLTDAVVFTEIVPDADLPAWYAGAACLVLPSRYEGFGFTPLEAMACGCPAIVSTAGSLPEITGGAALTVAPDDVGGLCAALRAVLEDSGLRRDLRARGLARAAAFSWAATARETLRVYDRVAVTAGSVRSRP